MEILSQEEVLQILKLVDESNTDEFHLEIGELKLTVKRSSEAVSTPIATDTAVPAPPTQDKVGLKITPPPIDSDADPTDQTGLTPIRASMLGTFYQSPKPGEPPFVKVGQMISADDTVCIIEVMKLFSTIKSGISGRVAEICVQDGDMVEFDQAIFMVDEMDSKETSQGAVAS